MRDYALKEYERNLRQCLCIFPALRTATLCVIALLWTFDTTALTYHLYEDLSEVFLPAGILIVLGTLTVGEWFFRVMYFLREGACLVLWVWLLVYLWMTSPVLIVLGLITAAFLAAPLPLYLILLHHHKQKPERAEVLTPESYLNNPKQED